MLCAPAVVCSHSLLAFAVQMSAVSNKHCVPLCVYVQSAAGSMKMSAVPMGFPTFFSPSLEQACFH